MTQNELFLRVKVKFDTNAFSAFVYELNKDNTSNSINSLVNDLIELFPKDLDRFNYPIIEDNGSLTQFGKLLVMRLSILFYDEFEGFIVSQEYKKKFSDAITRNNSNDYIFRNFLSRLSSASNQYLYQLNINKSYKSSGILYDLLDRYFYKDIVLIIDNVKKHIYLNKKEIKTFMNVMNKILSGINVNTYLECFEKYPKGNQYECKILYDDNKEYRIGLHNYCLYYLSEYPIVDYLFTLFELNPEDYKNENNYLVSMIRFISSLEKNEPTKYRKLCKYISEKIKKMKFGSLCLEKGYNLSLADESNYTKALINFNYSRFTRVRTYEINLENIEYLAYPIVNVPDEVLKEGRQISDEILANYFSLDDLSKAMELFYNPETTIDIKRKNDVAIGSCILGAMEKNTYDFIPDYDSYENRYNRLYIWCYLYKHGLSQYKTILWERIYSYLVKPLASKYKLHSVFEEDVEKHQQVLKKLFKSLNKYGIETSNVSDEFKENCLISLMDYSYSTLEQNSMFPVLEQLGDAIFDVVVTNLLYLDPRIRAKNRIEDTNCMNDIDTLKKKYCSADEQINIANELGLHEIYLVSDLDIKETYKKEKSEILYANYDAYHMKYFADSYEMIIGSIYKEFGLEAAYKFAEDTFLSVYSEFKSVKELSSILDPTGSNLVDLQVKLEEMCSEYGCYQYLCEVADYLLTVKPDFRVKLKDALFLVNMTENLGDLNYQILKISLMKLASIIIHGNDTKEQRKKLNIGTHDFIAKNHEYSIDSIALYEFLHHGVVAMIEAVKDNN